MLTFGSLFAGIGGMDLGLERSGMRCVWQVEIDPWCRRVLAKHWPDVRRHDDVRTFPPTDPGEWACDLVAGGFPCQDISKAKRLQGGGVGINGERSGLWAEFARCVRVLRPGLVLVENVPALLLGGIGRVLGDLAALGLDAEWHCLPAASFGAPHIRDRVFLLAYAQRERLCDPGRAALAGEAPPCAGKAFQWSRLWAHPRAVGPLAGVAGYGEDGPWHLEPDVGRVGNGLPHAMDRNRALGNAVVPQVAEFIGRRILAAL